MHIFGAFLLQKKPDVQCWFFTTVFVSNIAREFKILKNISLLRSSEQPLGFLLKSEPFVKLILHNQREKENGFCDEHLLFC